MGVAEMDVWRKLPLFLGLLITTVAGTTTLSLSTTSWYSAGTFLQYVQNERATIQLVVQIVSALLSVFQLYAISCLIKFGLNIRLRTIPTTLDSIKAVNAFYSRNLDWALPLQSLVLLLLYLLAIQVPAAIWAGALTPVVTEAPVSASVEAPAYGIASAPYWNYSCAPAALCGNVGTMEISDSGTLTYIPWKASTSLLVDAISTASSRNSSIPRHNKPDNSGFSFHGRSFGVGSAIGFTNITKGEESIQPLRYKYSELGYSSSVACMRNSSSQLAINGPLAYTDVDTHSIAVFSLNGSLPNGNWNGFPAWGININGSVVGIAAVKGDNRYLYGFVTGYYYANLSNIQCEVKFTPALFDISVDSVSRNISVLQRAVEIPMDSELHADSSMVLYNAFMQLSFVSQTLTTLYVSVLGQAFQVNIDNVRARESHEVTTEEDILTGVTEGIEAELDAALGIVGQAQIILARDSQNLAASAAIVAARIGDPKYAYIAFGINLAIVALVVFEAARTKFWRDLPLVNCLEVKSAILASAAGDLKLDDDVQSWDGDEADMDVGRIGIMLMKDKPCFVTSDGGSEVL